MEGAEGMGSAEIVKSYCAFMRLRLLILVSPGLCRV